MVNNLNNTNANIAITSGEKTPLVKGSHMQCRNLQSDDHRQCKDSKETQKSNIGFPTKHKLALTETIQDIRIEMLDDAVPHFLPGAKGQRI